MKLLFFSFTPSYSTLLAMGLFSFSLQSGMIGYVKENKGKLVMGTLATFGVIHTINSVVSQRNFGDFSCLKPELITTGIAMGGGLSLKYLLRKLWPKKEEKLAAATTSPNTSLNGSLNAEDVDPNDPFYHTRTFLKTRKPTAPPSNHNSTESGNNNQDATVPAAIPNNEGTSPQHETYQSCTLVEYLPFEEMHSTPPDQLCDGNDNPLNKSANHPTPHIRTSITSSDWDLIAQVGNDVFGGKDVVFLTKSPQKGSPSTSVEELKTFLFPHLNKASEAKGESWPVEWYEALKTPPKAKDRKKIEQKKVSPKEINNLKKKLGLDKNFYVWSNTRQAIVLESMPLWKLWVCPKSEIIKEAKINITTALAKLKKEGANAAKDLVRAHLEKVLQHAAPALDLQILNNEQLKQAQASAKNSTHSS